MSKCSLPKAGGQRRGATKSSFFSRSLFSCATSKKQDTAEDGCATQVVPDPSLLPSPTPLKTLGAKSMTSTRNECFAGPIMPAQLAFIHHDPAQSQPHPHRAYP